MEAKFTFPGGSRVRTRLGEFVIDTDLKIRKFIDRTAKELDDEISIVRYAHMKVGG